LTAPTNKETAWAPIKVTKRAAMALPLSYVRPKELSPLRQVEKADPTYKQSMKLEERIPELRSVDANMVARFK